MEMIAENLWWLIGCIAVIVGVVIYFKKHPFQITSVHKVEPIDIGPNASRAFEQFGGSIGDASQRVSDIFETAAGVVKPVTQGVGNLLTAATDRIGLRRKELDELSTNYRALLQENERLKSRAINVTQVEGQLKLALIELSQSYTSIAKKEIDSESPLIGGDWTTEFFGVRTADYKVQVGIDVEKLKFELDENKKIYVQGLNEIQLIGHKEINTDRRLAEIRKFTKSSTFGNGGVEILASSDAKLKNADSRLEEFSTWHAKTVEKEIQAIPQINYLKEMNAKMALAFLKICLMHSGCDVEEWKDERELTMNFKELCAKINERLNKLKAEQDSKIRNLEARREELTSEMLQIASGVN